MDGLQLLFFPTNLGIYMDASQVRIDGDIIARPCPAYTENVVPFISRLPDETLAEIFIHLASDYYVQYDGHATTYPPSWVNVSYVCRLWRDVALNCPNLWTYLFIVSPRWTEELLARSKQASLKVHVASSLLVTDRRELCFTKQVMEHVERVQEIHFELSTMNGVDEFFSLLSSRAPRLRNLEIEHSMYSGPERSSILFNGDTPALRVLKLKACPVPWYPFRLSGLTTLSLLNVPRQLQQNMGEVLVILRSMRDIKHLYLHRAISSSANFLSSEMSRTFQKIDLPHLSRFLIAAPLPVVVTLLSCVDFPLETELRLECTSHDSSPSDNTLPPHDDYTMLTSLLEQRFSATTDQAPSCMTIRSLVIDSPGFDDTALTFSASERDCNTFGCVSEEWGFDIPLRISISFHRSLHREDCVRITSDICCSIPLTQVQSVCVIEPPSSRDFWKKTLNHLPDLRYIKLCDGRMPDLASVLSLSKLAAPKDTGSWDMDVDQDLDGILAPALEKLELCSIFFPCGGDSKFWPQSLYDAPSSRKDVQGQLVMTECHLTGHYDKLYDLVGRWEGGRFHIISSRSVLLEPNRTGAAFGKCISTTIP